MARFTLPFKIAEIEQWSRCYTRLDEDTKPEAAGLAAAKRGYLEREEFLCIARWKSPRPVKWHELNSDDSIRSLSKQAFAANQSEAGRIESLDKLHGVAWRTATAILHLAFPDRYPLADVNAFSTLGVSISEDFSPEVWLEYVEFCKQTATDGRVTLRTLDRALWGHYDAQKKLRRAQRRVCPT